MITIKNAKETVILGTKGEKAIESALKYYIFNTGNKNALDVLRHIDPYWVFTWEKEMTQAKGDTK